ncbi:DUF6760 family protein [Cumulibacter manganitolerans]|nr:DUF6760 family protein [Cumulibacter manganitolerans]
MAFLCYHLHWSHDEVMSLEHRDRRLWATQVSALNERANALDAAD